MEIGKYSLINEMKVERAMSVAAKADGTYDESVLLAEYDKLGGLIKKGDDKVKNGSFFDFKNKKAFTKPQVFLTFNINGKIVDVAEDEEAPAIVKAARVAESEAKEEKITRRKK